MTDNEVYKTAIDFYGVKHQLVKLTEELGELTVAVSRYAQGEGDMYAIEDNLCEEIADVYIMLKQLELKLPIRPKILKWMEMKTRRLRVKVAKEKKERGDCT